MPNGTKQEKSKKSAEENALAVSDTMTDPLSGKEVINMKHLEPDLRRMVASKSKELQDAITEFGMSGLKIGKVLKEIELLLKPRGIFTQYVNSLPGFSLSTAYRWINGYEIAAKRFPMQILNRVIASGMAMIGDNKNPYGKYTEVVKKLPMPSGEITEDQADQWLGKVSAAYRKGRGGHGAKLPDAETLQKEAYQAIMKRYQKVPDNSKQYWIKTLVSYIAFNLGWPEIHAASKTPPKEWASTPKEKAEDEKEKGKSASAD